MTEPNESSIWGPSKVPGVGAEWTLSDGTSPIGIEELCKHLSSFPPNLDSIRHFLATLRPAFPDMRVTTESAAVEGDTITLKTIWHGTHTATFMGIPATARRVQFCAEDTVRVVGGRAVEQCGRVDYIGLLRQLGIIPA